MAIIYSRNHPLGLSRLHMNLNGPPMGKPIDSLCIKPAILLLYSIGAPSVLSAPAAYASGPAAAAIAQS